MGDWKPLIFSIIGIFIVGLFLSSFMEDFVDIEEKIEDNYATPFATMSGVFIQAVGTPALLFGELTQFIGGLFGGQRASQTESIITISGTGTHNNITLDGDYWLIETGYFLDGYFNAHHIREIDGTWYIVYNRLWWGIWTTRIYESVSEPFYEEWELLPQHEGVWDYNPTATGTMQDLEEPLGESTLADSMYEFVTEAREQVETNVNAFGLLPNIIGMPIIIIMLMSILYSLIKLIIPG